MTKVSVDKHEAEYEQNMQTLEYIKKEFQNTTSANSNNFVYLGGELCDLLERVLRNQDKVQHMIESYGLDQIQENNSEDNFDLDKENVKRIILKEISVGQVFYPSDIANEYNLDLKMVMDVMSELKENKQIIEKLG